MVCSLVRTLRGWKVVTMDFEDCHTLIGIWYFYWIPIMLRGFHWLATPRTASTCIHSPALPQDNNRDFESLADAYLLPAFSSSFHDVPFCLSIRFPLLPLLYFSFAKIAQPVPCKYHYWNRFIHLSLHKISTRFPHFLWTSLHKMWFFKIFLDIPCISHFPLLAPICT